MGEIAISVMCITYNQAEYIRDALEGILAQRTSFAFEILVHDDASTDGTDEILKEYQEKYPDKIRLFLEEENQYSKGADITRDFLLPHVRGKYMACCEGDDYWIYYGKLQAQYDLMEAHPEVSLCYHNAVVYDESKDELNLNVIDHKTGYVEDEDVIYPRKGWYPTASVLCRTEYMLSYHDLHAPTGDEGRRCYMACRGRLYFINEAWCVYRNRSKGSWNAKFDLQEEVANKYICGCIRFLEEFNAYTCQKYEKYFYNRLADSVLWYIGMHGGECCTLEEFRFYIDKLKVVTGHKVDNVLDEIRTAEATCCTDYYQATIKEKRAELCKGSLFLYGSEDMEVITVATALIIAHINICGIIVADKKNSKVRLLDYPIYDIDEIDVEEDMIIWPCVLKRRGLIRLLEDRGFKNIII